MKCFEHQDVDAVGSCRVCGKGLCSGCAVDQGFALSCSGECEEEARQIDAHNRQARKVLRIGRKNRYTGALLFAFMGGVFLIADLVDSGPRLSFMSIFGGGILLFSLYMAFASRELAEGRGKQGMQSADE